MQNGIISQTRDTANKRDQLLKLVGEIIAIDPYAYNGFQWAARPQEWYRENLGYSDSTLRRLIGKAPFVRACIQIAGKKVTLIREGVEGPASPKHVANIMGQIWKGEMVKRNMEAVVTRNQWGCLFGLAEVWPDGHQVEIFKLTLSRWSQFMEGAKIGMTLLQVEGKGQIRYFDYPSIPVIRRFSDFALELYIIEQQGKAA